MQILSGSAHGLRLAVPRGTRVRPTSARVRTSLFSILAATVPDARVVDLFAGSGALGIEALSRGAAACTFIEDARPALAALRDNLRRAHLASRATVLAADAFAALPLLEAPQQPPLDIVFLDPPYPILRRDLPRVLALLEALAASPALSPHALLVVQHDARTTLPDRLGPLAATDRRRYGGTALTFLERPSPGPD
jgi:16S rRNA (guanine(966)-N(2))-methyltransferase RsmD